MSNLTSDEEIMGRESLSLFELLLFCKDFCLMPKLVSKEEVTFVWKLITSVKKSHREKNILLEAFSKDAPSAKS
jgi:hypothetical protein